MLALHQRFVFTARQEKAIAFKLGFGFGFGFGFAFCRVIYVNSYSF